MTGGDYSALTPTVPGAVLEQWGLDVRDSVILRFASAAARDSALVGLGTADSGLAAWLQDVKQLTVFDGTNWVPATQWRMGAAEWTSGTSATTTETLVTGSSVTFTAVASRRYRVFVSTMFWSDAALDNVRLRLRSAIGSSVSNTDTLRRDVIVSSPAANVTVPISFVEEITGFTGGTRTVGLFVNRYNGTGTVSTGNVLGSDNSIVIDDVGPA